jgi:hypothetical protein
MRIIIRHCALPLCTLLIVTLGQSPADGQGQGKKVDIRGVITSVAPADEDDPSDVLGEIEVQGEVEEDTNYDWAIVTVTDDTRIRRPKGERPRRGSFEDLDVGDIVEVRFEGPVLLTYPVQGARGPSAFSNSLSHVPHGKVGRRHGRYAVSRPHQLKRQ